jgi:hypothetical protein
MRSPTLAPKHTYLKLQKKPTRSGAVISCTSPTSSCTQKADARLSLFVTSPEGREQQRLHSAAHHVPRPKQDKRT